MDPTVPTRDLPSVDSEADHASPPREVEKPRIVVVDDDLAMRRLLEKSLSRFFDVTAAEDGILALEAVHATQPSVVVSDFHMPNMSGVELCAALKENAATQHIPVILLTADSDPQLMDSSLEGGADDYVRKPFRKNELIARVRAAHRISQNYTALDQAHRALQKSQQALVESQKLEAVGRLAGGVAHEINTPLQFLCDNCRFLEESFESLIRLASAQAWQGSGTLEEALAQHQTLAEEIGLDFLREQVPGAVQDTLVGLEKVSSIVRALMVYSDVDNAASGPCDLLPIVEDLRPEITERFEGVATIIVDLPADLPKFRGVPSKVREVIFSLLVNAAEAIARQEDRDGIGTVFVQGRVKGEFLEIELTDDGPGISDSVRERIFDPFFTTKAEGEGLGQGLAMARAVIVDQQGGYLELESEESKGTSFFVGLPLEGTCPSP